MLERWRDGETERRQGHKSGHIQKKNKTQTPFFFKCIALAIVVEPNEHGKQHQFNASFMFFIFD